MVMYLEICSLIWCGFFPTWFNALLNWIEYGIVLENLLKEYMKREKVDGLIYRLLNISVT